MTLQHKVLSPVSDPFGTRRACHRLFLLILALWIFIPQVSWALRPMSHDIALVAGEGIPGFRDGSFTSALFNKPLGLAISTDGTRLFVADSGNNRIRIVHLDQDNQVTTLCGQDKPGWKNGPLSSARFNSPQAVAYLPGDRLVVYDSGNKLMRLVD